LVISDILSIFVVRLGIVPTTTKNYKVMSELNDKIFEFGKKIAYVFEERLEFWKSQQLLDLAPDHGLHEWVLAKRTSSGKRGSGFGLSCQQSELR
jgi:hypothetical protein